MMGRFLFWLLLLLPALAFSQKKQGQARLDSLLSEVRGRKEDTATVKLMDTISCLYNYINPDEGLKWAEKVRALSQKLHWQKGEGVAYNDFGNNYQFKNAYPEALAAYFQSLRIAEEQKDQMQISRVLGNIGLVYWAQKNYPRALEYSFKSLRIEEVQADKKSVWITLSNIGGIYNEQGKHKQALTCQLKALQIAEVLGDKDGIGAQTGNIGFTYQSLEQYNTALAYHFKALRLSEEIGDRLGVSTNLGNIGETYYLIASDSAAPRPDNLVSASRADNLSKAVAYLNRSVIISREVQDAEGVLGSLAVLSKTLSLQGDYRGALETYKQSVALHDSLYNTANNEAITNLETKRAVELKDKDILIARLKKRNERIFSISGFAVLLLVTGMLFRSYRRQQHSNVLLSKEKKRSDDLLLNILPAEVAEELKDNGASAARQYDQVSVLFTDFVNFTSTAEHLSPQELVQELHACFSAFDAIIERAGLEKIKTIGDAYMAVCGLPVADERHAQRTVQAALEIRDFIAERAKRERAFQIRIGVNSGPVVAGIVGVKKFAYDIWGDTVNTANRMESASEPGQVNISQSTYALVKEEYKCTPRGKVNAKGKGEVEMYFVAQK